MKYLMILFLFWGISPVVWAINIYVSPFGNDTAAGTKRAPLATLEKAQQLVLNNSLSRPNSNYTIWLYGGEYVVDKPLVFSSDDFPGKGKLTVKAIDGQKPVISGGIKMRGWHKNNSGLWVTQLPPGITHTPPRELFVEGTKARRARFPDNGYLRVKKAGDDRRTHFYFNENDFPIPTHPDGVELVLLHDWSVSRIPVKEIDGTQNKLTAVDSIGARKPSFFSIDNWEPHPRYFLENAMEFLNADYEWCFRQNTNQIFLKLPENRDANDLEIVLPHAVGLVYLSGTEMKPIKNIRFEGISFENCAWPIPESGYCGIQACHYDPRPERGGWEVVSAAIHAEWANDCAFTRCTFQNLGGSGLWFSTGSQNCVVSQSLFRNISGNGIMIGEGTSRKVNGVPWWQLAPEQVAVNNRIENCTITNCGTQFFGAVGIWCGITAETMIRNNEIYNLPYTGISIGWMWNPVATPCRDNVIHSNHIHHVLRTLSDGGGVYMLGRQSGSKITNNHIHDVQINVGRAESNGMFLDEGTTDVEIKNNLIYNIARSPLRFHKASTNVVKKNWLFCTADNPPIRYNATRDTDILKINNKVFVPTSSVFEKHLNKRIRKQK